MSSRNDISASETNGAILMISITVILSVLVLLQVIQLPSVYYRQEVPTIFEIKNIRHTNQNGVLNFESYMVVQNTGKLPFDNRKLYAKTYRNGELLPCFISTINGNDFIPTHHFGVQTIGGFGTHDYYWYPSATIAIDYSQNTLHPGDIVQFEVYDRDTNRIISRDIWPHTGGTEEKWLDVMF